MDPFCSRIPGPEVGLGQVLCASRCFAKGDREPMLHKVMERTHPVDTLVVNEAHCLGLEGVTPPVT